MLLKLMPVCYGSPQVQTVHLAKSGTMIYKTFPQAVDRTRDAPSGCASSSRITATNVHLPKPHLPAWRKEVPHDLRVLHLTAVLDPSDLEGQVLVPTGSKLSMHHDPSSPSSLDSP